MNYGLYVSAGGMRAQEARQAVVTNNLANSKTVGFKRDLAMIQARANAAYEDPRMRGYRMPPFSDQGGGVTLQSGGIDLTQGMLETSRSATDVALQGRGFFTVGGKGSETHGGKLLTRDGRFLKAADGSLVTADGGRPVLDDAGQPIVLNPNLGVTIDENGVIRQGEGAGVKLGVVDVKDPRKIVKLGQNLLTTSEAADVVEAKSDTQVLQYHTEASSVDPTAEIVNIMEGMRAFEANARMISYTDQTMSQLNTVGRVA